MIDKGKELDWFGSNQIIVLAIVAVVGFLFFLAWELTEENPIVDLRLFGQRNFLMGTLALSVGYGLFFGNVVLLPLWLQQYMGYTATWAGMALAPVGVLAIVLSPWVGKNVSRIDPRRLATVAFLGFALVLWMRSRFNVQADFLTVLIPTIVQGAAMAFFFIPLQAIIFSGLTPDRMPAAAGLSNFVRITAGAMGTSIFTTAWENRAVLHTRAAQRIDQRRQHGDDGRAEPARRGRLHARAGARHDQPDGRPAGLHAGRERSVPAVRRRFPAAGRHCCGRRGRNAAWRSTRPTRIDRRSACLSQRQR
jgi:EmrB/QacA subfamily drug resistance transporter